MMKVNRQGQHSLKATLDRWTNDQGDYLTAEEVMKELQAMIEESNMVTSESRILRATLTMKFVTPDDDQSK